MKPHFLVFASLLPTLAACGATTSAESPAASSTVSDAGSSSSSSATGADGGTTGVSNTKADASTSTTTKDTTCSASTDEGDACSVEGAFCQTSPCTDECQFCNTLHCEGGKWGRMEAFPMPESYCASVPCGAATCGKGEFCVRMHSGPQPLEGGSGVSSSCAKLPSGCTGCNCATAASCAGMYSQCNADPTTGKPGLDCYAQ